MTTRREYDLLNRLRRVESLSTATNTLGLVFDYQYNQANQRRRIDNGDGTHWAIEYDDLGQVVGGKKYWPDGSAVPGQQFEYDFDDIGNRTAHRYGGDATGQSSKLREVGYTANSLNQYTAKANVSVVDLLGLATEGSVVSVNGSTNGVYRRGEYFHRAATNTANTWPSLTNVVSKSGTSVTNIGSIFIPPTPEAFTHDADGNLTQDGRWDYTWDGENRLAQMESKSGFPAGSKRKLEFEYDWQGRRIKKVSHSAWNGSSYATVVTTKFIYDGWNLLGEFDSSNNVIRGYVWGTDLSGTMQGAGGVGGLLFVKESDGTPHFAAYDGNGNVMGLVKGTDGTRTATYEYDPFGQPLRATGTMSLANPMRFSTKFTENETGLLYYGHRFYNPSTGRWMSRDPIEEEGGNNLYHFNYNDPLGYIDPLGHNPGAIVVGGITIGALEAAAAIFGISAAACMLSPDCMAAAAKITSDTLDGIWDSIVSIARKCRPKKRCRDCIPAVGTRMYVVHDRATGSRPHWINGTKEPIHTHHTYVTQRSINAAVDPCKCDIREDKGTATPGNSPAPREIPEVPPAGGGVQWYF